MVFSSSGLSGTRNSTVEWHAFAHNGEVLIVDGERGRGCLSHKPRAGDGREQWGDKSESDGGERGGAWQGFMAVRVGMVGRLWT
jgi:hypothetical protein